MPNSHWQLNVPNDHLNLFFGDQDTLLKMKLFLIGDNLYVSLIILTDHHQNIFERLRRCSIE